MHTFEDWELRQLLEDVLDDAKHHFVKNRAYYAWPHAQTDLSRCWWEAAREAIDAAMAARWHSSTRPTAAD